MHTYETVDNKKVLLLASTINCKNPYKQRVFNMFYFFAVEITVEIKRKSATIWLSLKDG